MEGGSLLGRGHGLLHSTLDTKLGSLELLGGGVLDLELLKSLGDLRLDLSLGSSLDLGTELGGREGLLDGVQVSLEVGLGLVLGREVLVGLLELLGVLDHLVNLGGRQSTDRVLDRDLSLSARGSVHGGNLEETVGVDLESADELGLTSGHRGDTGELKLTQESVVLALSSLTLVHGERDSGLVVLDGGESSGLVGGDGGVSGQDNTENVTLHGDTEGERSDIEQEQVSGLVRGLTSEDGSLDGGTVSDGLIGVDRLVELSTTEVLGDEGLDLGNSGRTTNEDNVLDLGGGDLGVLEDLVNRVDSGLEGSSVDLLESSSGDGGGKVDTL